MRTSPDDLHTRVVVRRIGVGTAPFAWEIHRENFPAHVSPDRFRTMEAAYSAGQARLGEFLSDRPTGQKKVRAPKALVSRIMGNDDWESDEDESDEVDLDIHSEVPQMPASNPAAP